MQNKESSDQFSLSPDWVAQSVVTGCTSTRGTKQRGSGVTSTEVTREVHTSTKGTNPTIDGIDKGAPSMKSGYCDSKGGM